MTKRNRLFPTIAVFSEETYETYYQLTLLEGVVDAARHNNLNLIIVSGSELDNPYYHRRSANILYRWITAENVDGVIPVTIIFNNVSQEERQNFYDGLRPLPFVGMGKIENILPCITVDNEVGLQELIRHLIVKHQYRRLAFVNGPEQNVDAQVRFAVYKSMLSEYNLPLDPALIVPGDFTYRTGKEAVRILWDERRVEVDAIISSNDDMAFGILEALQSRNVNVPDQVALTGFDDAEEAWTSNPSLTTVHQPIYQLAYKSVEILMQQLQEIPVKDSYNLAAEPVYRRSCGCNSPAVQQTLSMGKASEKVAERKLEDLLSQNGVNIISSAFRSTTKLSGAIADQCEKLVQMLILDIEKIHQTQQPEAFLLALEQGVRDTFMPSDKAIEWHTFITLIRQILLPFREQHPLVWIQLESLFQASHVLISEWLQREQISRQFREDVKSVPIRFIMRDLVTALDENSQMNVLADVLPVLGIPDCYVALYDPENIGGQTRLILAYENHKRFLLDEGGQFFPSPQSLISMLTSMEKQQVLIMESLHFRDHCMGFVVFGLGTSIRQQVDLHIRLRESISDGLQAMRLVQEVEQRNSALEDAYRTLRENQQKLLIAEKMASLGRITAGIAHEMNTPLAATRAALRKATQLADEYKLSIDDPGVTDDDHKEIAEEIISVVKLADTAAGRAASFVRDIKIQTRNFKPLENQTINVGRVIENSLLLLYYALENNECKVDYQSSDDNIQVLGPPGRLEQVVTNLVNNAIDACASEGGEISIKLDQHEGYVELQVSDNGSGISSENLPKIFDPMFSTKPFGTSTGLGLTIVHDIVVGDFNGSIDAQSRVGEGTIFTIHIPIKK